MRYPVVALVALLLAGCGGGGESRPGPSYSPAAQARTVSANVSRPLTAADCTRQLQEEAGRTGMTAVNVQIQTTPTGFSCTGQLAPR